MINQNLLLMTDSYKASHFDQYEPGIEKVFSYLESRGGRYPQTVFFGLQYLLKEYLQRSITEADVAEADEFFKAHGEPFNREGWLYIAKELNGKLPLRIRAVPEGSVVPTHNVLMTVENTDPRCFWLPSYVETLLMRIWYPITVATQSWHIRRLILQYLERSSDDPQGEITFKLHDFGARGVSSHESAAIGGAAHLINFMGSDTVEGVLMARQYYACPMAAYSIPAAEHSTITSWGKDREVDAYRNMIQKFGKPGALVAVVSDSYDIEKAVRDIWGEELRQEVIKSGATIVIRPDSGDPATVVSRIADILGDKYGYIVNNHDFKVLKNLRIIQGDGINEGSIKEILDKLLANGWSASNVAFGMGGALLQQVNRDTQRFAYKCSSVCVSGKHRDVYKDPITDPGKRSRGGRLDLILTPDGEYKTLPFESQDSVLETVFENGRILKEYSFEDIRNRAKNWSPVFSL